MLWHGFESAGDSSYPFPFPPAANGGGGKRERGIVKTALIYPA
jgi:hypothetical protein